MSLNNFFTINLPYGMIRNENNEWAAFNREYLPLGSNFKTLQQDFSTPDTPLIYTKYSNLTEKLLCLLAHNEESIKRNKKGEIINIFFYDDKTNPTNHEIFQDHYFMQYTITLQLLSTLKVDNS